MRGPPSHEQPIHILLVEDNPGDVRLTQESFNEGRIKNNLHVVTHGSDALDYLKQRGKYEDNPRPDIILLDLNLPDLNGITVLKKIKQMPPELKRIPIIVLTSSDADEDVINSYEEHANAYLKKPIDPDEFIDLARTITDFWLRMVKLPPDDA